MYIISIELAKFSMEEMFMTNCLSAEEIKAQFGAVCDRAEKLGVLDINFSASTPPSGDSLECYERALGVIEKNKQRYDQNAGEA
jgi:hypothetical protein